MIIIFVIIKKPYISLFTFNIPGVYIQTNSQNLVRGKKSTPKKKGEKISQRNDDKKGIKGKRGQKNRKNWEACSGKKREAVGKKREAEGK